MSAHPRAAIDAALAELSAAEWDGDLIVDWVLIAGLVSPDGEHTIAPVMSRENMPMYVASGLLTEGHRVTSPDRNE